MFHRNIDPQEVFGAAQGCDQQPQWSQPQSLGWRRFTCCSSDGPPAPAVHPSTLL